MLRNAGLWPPAGVFARALRRIAHPREHSRLHAHAGRRRDDGQPSQDAQQQKAPLAIRSADAFARAAVTGSGRLGKRTRAPGVARITPEPDECSVAKGIVRDDRKLTIAFVGSDRAPASNWA